MRAHIYHTVAAILVLLTACNSLTDDPDVQNPDDVTAQYAAAVDAVLKDTDIEAVNIVLPSDMQQAEQVRKALSVSRATCENDECLDTDVSMALIGLENRFSLGENQVRVFVSRTVPRHQDGRSSWHTANFRVDLQKTREGWTVTDMQLTGTS